MSGLRFDRLLASAAVALLLAAPPSALGQETVPSEAGLIDHSKAGDAPPMSAGEALTSSAVGVVQMAAPAGVPEEGRAPDPCSISPTA
jgi:hypothetical protein